MPRQNQPWEVLRTNMAYGWNTGTSITDMHCDLKGQVIRSQDKRLKMAPSGK